VKGPCQVESGRFSELPDSLYKWTLLTIVTALALTFNDSLRAQTPAAHRCFEVRTRRMDVDVDEPRTPTAHLASRHSTSLGMRTIWSGAIRRLSATSWTTGANLFSKARRIRFPATTFSQTAFADLGNHNERDPRSYGRRPKYPLCRAWRRGSPAGREGRRLRGRIFRA